MYEAYDIFLIQSLSKIPLFASHDGRVTSLVGATQYIATNQDGTVVIGQFRYSGIPIYPNGVPA